MSATRSGISTSELQTILNKVIKNEEAKLDRNLQELKAIVKQINPGGYENQCKKLEEEKQVLLENINVPGLTNEQINGLLDNEFDKEQRMQKSNLKFFEKLLADLESKKIQSERTNPSKFSQP